MFDLKNTIKITICSLFIASSANASKIEVKIQNGNDDAEERIHSGSMYLTSSDLELVEDGVDQAVGLRFNSVKIPKNAKIKHAHIRFSAKDTHNGEIALRIFGEKSANSATFNNNDRNISSRRRTNPSAYWKPSAWAKDSKYNTPYLGHIIEDIIKLDDWKYGNSITFLIFKDHQKEYTGKRNARSRNGGESKAPTLYIEYEGGRPDIPIIPNPTPDLPTTPPQEQGVKIKGSDTDFCNKYVEITPYNSDRFVKSRGGEVYTSPISGDHSKFKIKCLDNGNIAFDSLGGNQAYKDRSHSYAVNETPGRSLKANRSNIGFWEKFTLYKNENSTYSFENRGKFCSETFNGNKSNITCNSNSIGDKEKFNIETRVVSTKGVLDSNKICFIGDGGDSNKQLKPVSDAIKKQSDCKYLAFLGDNIYENGMLEKHVTKNCSDKGCEDDEFKRNKCGGPNDSRYIKRMQYYGPFCRKFDDVYGQLYHTTENNGQDRQALITLGNHEWYASYRNSWPSDRGDPKYPNKKNINGLDSPEDPRLAWRKAAKYYKNIIYPETELYHSKEIGDICIFALDSNVNDMNHVKASDIKGGKYKSGSILTKNTLNALANKQVQWFKKEKKRLKEKGKCKLSIVIAHHPIFETRGTRQRKLLPEYVSSFKNEIVGKVDLYLAGHDHHMEVQKDVNGTRTIIVGNSSRNTGILKRDIKATEAGEKGRENSELAIGPRRTQKELRKYYLGYAELHYKGNGVAEIIMKQNTNENRTADGIVEQHRLNVKGRGIR